MGRSVGATCEWCGFLLSPSGSPCACQHSVSDEELEELLKWSRRGGRIAILVRRVAATAKWNRAFGNGG